MRVNFQFHSPRDELVTLLTRAVEGFDVQVVLEEPSAAHDVAKIGIDDLADVLRDRPLVRRFAVSAGAREAQVHAAAGFLASNRGALIVDLGDEDGNSLRQSCVMIDASEPEQIRVWRKVLGRLKAGMAAGATVTNPQTGARTWSRVAWYSPGAQRLQEAGTRMLAMAGWNEYQFGEEVQATAPRKLT